MESTYYYIFGILIFLFIVYFYIISSVNTLYYNFLEGLWIATESFCHKANIDGMILFIGASDNKLGRSSYLIMYSDDKVVVDTKINIIFGSSIFPDLSERKIDIILNLNNKKVNLNDVIPSNLECEISIDDGKMIWSKDDTVYAEFYKDNISSKIKEEVDSEIIS